jgi:hypothetical protein
MNLKLLHPFIFSFPNTTTFLCANSLKSSSNQLYFIPIRYSGKGPSYGHVKEILNKLPKSPNANIIPTPSTPSKPKPVEVIEKPFTEITGPKTQTQLVQPLNCTKQIFNRGYATEVAFGFHPTRSLNISQQFPILQETIPGHINKLVFTCANPGCNMMTCTGLCSFLSSIRNKGNFTHMPPAGSNYIFISQFDIFGNKKNQYFVYNKKATEFKEDPTASSDTGLTLDAVAQEYAKKHGV